MYIIFKSLITGPIWPPILHPVKTITTGATALTETTIWTQIGRRGPPHQCSQPVILQGWMPVRIDDTLQWRHNELDGVSNHQPHDCSLNRLFRHRSKKISKLRVTGLCEGKSPVTGEFPAQRASNAKNVSIWWRHRENQQSSPYRWLSERRQ